jgi:RNA polymerase sigma-70 factor, ECF subfamily
MWLAKQAHDPSPVLPTASTRASGFFPRAATKSLSDAALLEAMLRDDPRAWREFMRRHNRIIYRCITQVTRAFAQLVTRDDTHEIRAILFCALLVNDRAKLRSFDPERGVKLSTWIGLLAVRASWDFLRARRREPNRTTLLEAAHVAWDAPDAFAATLAREQAAAVTRAARTFSASDRTFLELCFGSDLPPAAIARRMGISVKTVYSKKSKIQARLSQALG